MVLHFKVDKSDVAMSTLTFSAKGNNWIAARDEINFLCFSYQILATIGKCGSAGLVTFHDFRSLPCKLCSGIISKIPLN